LIHHAFLFSPSFHYKDEFGKTFVVTEGTGNESGIRVQVKSKKEKLIEKHLHLKLKRRLRE